MPPPLISVRVKTMSSAVNGVPSLHSTPSRTLIVTVLLSEASSQDSACQGICSPVFRFP